MEKVFILLGSNLGDRKFFLEKAITEMTTCSKINVSKLSSTYETEPYGFFDQPYFLNQALEIFTSLEPKELLTFCKNTEDKIGRNFREKWHCREIDIDIIFFGDKVINLQDLVIPHYDLYNRLFVLVPLREIAEDFCCPKTGLKISEILEKCSDQSKVKIFN